jgi:hypothetical protein
MSGMFEPWEIICAHPTFLALYNQAKYTVAPTSALIPVCACCAAMPLATPENRLAISNELFDFDCKSAVPLSRGDVDSQSCDGKDYEHRCPDRGDVHRWTGPTSSHKEYPTMGSGRTERSDQDATIGETEDMVY